MGKNAARAWQQAAATAPVTQVRSPHGHLNEIRVETGRMVRCVACASNGTTTWILAGDAYEPEGP